ncbi:MAG: hypothetical protein ACOYPR_11045 [Saprospiraceae bacterium]|jgi:hypothetical protein
MDNVALQQTSQLIKGDFELSSAPESEAALLDMLADRIDQMLATQPEYLMSMLYRMDVLEHKINRVMHPAAPEPAPMGLARLVLERQLQRVETKRTIKPAPLDDWEEWTL